MAESVSVQDLQKLFKEIQKDSSISPKIAVWAGARLQLSLKTDKRIL